MNEVAVSSVHSSPLTFMIVTEREAAVRNVHSSPLTFMTVTESECAVSSVHTHSQGLLPHGQLSLKGDHHHIGQEGDEVDDQHRQDGQRRSAEEGTDEIAAERKQIQGEKAWA